VTKGLTQTYVVDYLETAKMNTVRVILSLATNYDWDLWQFDAKNAFLFGDLEEEYTWSCNSIMMDRLFSEQFASLKRHYMV